MNQLHENLCIYRQKSPLTLSKSVRACGHSCAFLKPLTELLPLRVGRHGRLVWGHGGSHHFRTTTWVPDLVNTEKNFYSFLLSHKSRFSGRLEQTKQLKAASEAPLKKTLNWTALEWLI